MKPIVLFAAAACVLISAPAMGQPQSSFPPERPPAGFDAEKIGKLLDKREPAARDTSDFDALRKRIMKNWRPPAGPPGGVVTLEVKLTPDGHVAERPAIVSVSPDAAHAAALSEGAIKALYNSEPFDMLAAAEYDKWKLIQITFDPREWQKLKP